jgi:hypothetical protein
VIMECHEAEEYLSGYMELELPADAMRRVAGHLDRCPDCSALLEEMRRTVTLCRSLPEPEMDGDLLERILERTSGRAKPAPLLERLGRFAVQPMLMQRFAFGAGLAAVFIALMANLVPLRMSEALSSLSPSGMVSMMDRGVRRLYGEGIKAYDKKNEWEAQLTYMTGSVIHRLRYMMERFDIPAEGGAAPKAPEPDSKSAPRRQNSSLRMWAG